MVQKKLTLLLFLSFFPLISSCGSKGDSNSTTASNPPQDNSYQPPSTSIQTTKPTQPGYLICGRENDQFLICSKASPAFYTQTDLKTFHVEYHLDCNGLSFVTGVLDGDNHAHCVDISSTTNSPNFVQQFGLAHELGHLGFKKQPQHFLQKFFLAG